MMAEHFYPHEVVDAAVQLCGTMPDHVYVGRRHEPAIHSTMIAAVARPRMIRSRTRRPGFHALSLRRHVHPIDEDQQPQDAGEDQHQREHAQAA